MSGRGAARGRGRGRGRGGGGGRRGRGRGGRGGGRSYHAQAAASRQSDSEGEDDGGRGKKGGRAARKARQVASSVAGVQDFAVNGGGGGGGGGGRSKRGGRRHRHDNGSDSDSEEEPRFEGFAPHWEASEAEAALASGLAAEGVFRTDPERPATECARVTGDDGALLCLVDGPAHRNRAIDGDRVVVRPLASEAEERAARAAYRRRLAKRRRKDRARGGGAEEKGKGDDDDDDDDAVADEAPVRFWRVARVSAPGPKRSGGGATAKATLRGNRREALRNGSVGAAYHGDAHAALVPRDRSWPVVLLPLDALEGADLAALVAARTELEVAFDSWPEHLEHPVVRLAPGGLPPAAVEAARSALAEARESYAAKRQEAAATGGKGGGRSGGGSQVDNEGAPTGASAPRGDGDKGSRKKKKKGKAATPAAAGAAAAAPANRRRAKRKMFAPHLQPAAVAEMVARGELYLGRIRVNASNPRQCYVSVDGARTSDPDVFVDGARSRNRAFDGDRVAIRLEEDLSKWRMLESDSDHARRERLERLVDEGIAAGGDEKAAAPAPADARKPRHVPAPARDDKGALRQPTGRVVAILGDSGGGRGTTAGYLRPENDRVARFTPVDGRAPLGFLRRRGWPKSFAKRPDAPEEQQILYVCRYEEWEDTDRMPWCRVERTIGRSGTVATETEALLTQFGIDYDHSGEFPAAVRAEMEPFRGGDWEIPAEEVARRRDLRGDRIFSIDPTTARDLDDALSIRRLDDGSLRVGVHIADVTHFVRPGTAVDREAQKRCTSVYLVQRVLPMLPRVLCENLCSLNPGVDRLAFSVYWTMTEDGRVVGEQENAWFGRTVIRSCAKLDYASAQAAIEQHERTGSVAGLELPEDRRPHAPHRQDDMLRDVVLLDTVARRRRARRFEHGSLALNRVKLVFELDAAGNPTRAGAYKHKDSNRLVEEFMLLANQIVARRISSRVPTGALLRRHPPPLDRGIEKVRELARLYGVPFSTSSAGAIHRSLQALGDVWQNGANMKEMMEMMIMGPMVPAVYFNTADEERPEWAHYALAFDVYTHYTSPIRRYADCVVHRLLQWTIDEDERANAAAADKGGGGQVTGDGDHDDADDDDDDDDEAEEERSGPAKAPSPSSSTAAPPSSWISATAEKCNTRKLNARKAQEQSDRVFLCLLLRQAPRRERAIVYEFGTRSVEVFVRELGLELRVHLDDIRPARAAIVGDGDALQIEWSPGRKAKKKKKAEEAEEEEEEEEEEKGRGNARGGGRRGRSKGRRREEDDDDDGDEEGVVADEEDEEMEGGAGRPSASTQHVELFGVLDVELFAREGVRISVGVRVLAPWEVEPPAAAAGAAEEAAHTAAVASAAASPPEFD